MLRWKKGQRAAIRIAVETSKSVQEKTKEYIIQQIRAMHIVRENAKEMGEKSKTLKTKLYRFILFQLMQFVHSNLSNTSELPVGI